MYLNIRGLKSKFDSLLTKIEEVEPTIFCITETHLLKEEPCEIDGYEILRPVQDSGGNGGIVIGVRMK